MALILGLAICSYTYIETPLRKGNWFGKRWKTLILGGGILVTLSGGLFALEKPLKGKLYTGKKTISNSKEDWRNQIRLGNSSLTGKKCHAEKNYSSEDLKLLFNECKFPLNRKSNNQKTRVGNWAAMV